MGVNPFSKLNQARAWKEARAAVGEVSRSLSINGVSQKKIPRRVFPT
jgi:hypothetical protein